jgi:hypothetical protein
MICTLALLPTGFLISLCLSLILVGSFVHSAQLVRSDQPDKAIAGKAFNFGLRDYLDSTHPNWEHLIDRTAKEVISMQANKTEDWQHSIDSVPTAGVSVLQIKTYEYYTANNAVWAAWTAKREAAKVPLRKAPKDCKPHEIVRDSEPEGPFSDYTIFDA